MIEIVVYIQLMAIVVGLVAVDHMVLDQPFAVVVDRMMVEALALVDRMMVEALALVEGMMVVVA